MIVRVIGFVNLIVLFSTASPRANSECIVVTDWDAAKAMRDSDLVFPVSSSRTNSRTG
jgi:hypothetical protein